MPNPDYKIVISDETFEKLNKYKQQLQSRGLESAGHYLKLLLESKFNNTVNNGLNSLTDEDFLNLLLKTKISHIKNAANNDFRFYWNPEEQAILNHIGYIINVRAFNNGSRWYQYADAKGNIQLFPYKQTHSLKQGKAIRRNHNSSINATILYGCSIPDEFNTSLTAGVKEITNQNKDYNSVKLNLEEQLVLIKKHLLPLLISANKDAETIKKEAIIILPELQEILPYHLRSGHDPLIYFDIIKNILLQHSDQLHNIKAVRVDDPYYDKDDVTEKITDKQYLLLRPSRKQANLDKQPLYPPAYYNEPALGLDFSKCKLYCLVFSSNPFLPPGISDNSKLGLENFDTRSDLAIISATDACFKLTGTEGTYDYTHQYYKPPKKHKNWNDLFEDNALPKEIFITSNNGDVKKLKGNNLIKVENSKTNNHPASPLKLTVWQKHKKKIIAVAFLSTAMVCATIGLVLTATGFGTTPGIPLTAFGVKLGFNGLALFGINAGLGFVYGLAVSATMGFFSSLIIGVKNLFNAAKNFAKKFIDRTTPIYMDEIPEEKIISTTYNNLSIRTQKSTHQFDTSSDNSDAKKLSHHTPSILTKKIANTPCCKIVGATKEREINKTVLHISVFDSNRLKNIVVLLRINGFNPVQKNIDSGTAVITITHLDRNAKGGLNKDSIKNLIILLVKLTNDGIDLIDPKTDFKQLKIALYEANELNFDSLNNNNPEFEAKNAIKKTSF